MSCRKTSWARLPTSTNFGSLCFLYKGNLQINCACRPIMSCPPLLFFSPRKHLRAVARLYPKLLREHPERHALTCEVNSRNASPNTLQGLTNKSPSCACFIESTGSVGSARWPGHILRRIPSGHSGPRRRIPSLSACWCPILIQTRLVHRSLYQRHRRA